MQSKNSQHAFQSRVTVNNLHLIFQNIFASAVLALTPQGVMSTCERPRDRLKIQDSGGADGKSPGLGPAIRHLLAVSNFTS